MEALASNEIGKREKIKTHFARIVVGGTAEKPCYGILYFDPSDGEYHQGFGSYVLEYVFNWLAEEFEITGDAFSNEPDRHGEWIGAKFDGYADRNPVYYLWQCSCCHEEYERDGMPWYDYCPNCGAKMDGGTSNGNIVYTDTVLMKGEEE